MMNKRKDTIILILTLLILAFTTIGYADEVMFYDSVVTIGPAEYEVYPTTEYGMQPYMPEQTLEIETAVNWIRVTFFDLSGNEIAHRDLQEGDAIFCPDYIPYQDGKVFQFWYDRDRPGEPSPFIFGQPAMGNTSLAPYYHHQSDTMQSLPPVTGEVATFTDNSMPLIETILTYEGGTGGIRRRQWYSHLLPAQRGSP